MPRLSVIAVTALTIALALADTSLLRLLRVGSQHVQRAAGALVVLSGLYLVYYFWVVDVNEDTSAVTARVDSLQRRLVVALQDRWQFVALTLAAVVGWAVVFVASRRRGESS